MFYRGYMGIMFPYSLLRTSRLMPKPQAQALNPMVRLCKVGKIHRTFKGS